MQGNKCCKKIFQILLLTILASTCLQSQSHPRVFIFTDINIDAGDPDDRQSLIHLFWYADQLNIEGIVPDRIKAGGYDACLLAVEAYRKDYEHHKWSGQEFMHPDSLKMRIASSASDGKVKFLNAIRKMDTPLYVLVWGNMESFSTILLAHPELAPNIRLITIGTGLMLESNIPHMPPNWERSPPCVQLNWNGKGRNLIYNNELFDKLWWLEINWTYEGMFDGKGPKEMFESLSKFGRLGAHMKEVVKNQEWAQYFRVGDTPSVLYVIDSDHDLDDPRMSSWAGQFFQPFPKRKPGYFTDRCDRLDWNYADPCSTWDQHIAMRDCAVQTLVDRRSEMYKDLLGKLEKLYSIDE